MDRALLARLTRWIARPAVRAVDPDGIGALERALGGADPPVAVGRWGTVIAYRPGPGRRRLLELDRRGRLIGALRWKADGTLGWARCLTAEERWVGIEPAAASHPAWGRSDRLWLLDADGDWAPREALTVFQALAYERPDFIPPLWEPRRLPPGAGTAVLNLLAGLMKDQGLARVRYRGPYPTEQLFTSLLECFRYDPAAAAPLERFLDGADLDWLPAPHERHHVAPGLCVQQRHEIDKVVLDGVAFYRPDWQGLSRREPRLVRREGERAICSLWALGRSLEDRLVLDASGEVLARPAPAEDARPPAPLAPGWHPALADLIARESAPALAEPIRQVLTGLLLEWGPVPGDFLRAAGGGIRLSARLRDAGLAWLREAPQGARRAARAARFVLEVARLLAPEVRPRAQARLEARGEEEQRRTLAAGAAPGPGLSESVGRLVAWVAAGGA
jgi:hypothetical protein